MRAEPAADRRIPATGTGFAWIVLALACLGQWPLVLNPGYFSHDELQWAAWADVPAGQALPWVSWTGVEAYQFRPLTFNLWLLLSRWWFGQPMLFHAFCVLWGSLNAMALALLGRRFGMPPWPAALGALAFALGPYAVYVHGWVGTMADLIWLSCALIIGLIVVRTTRPVLAFAAALAFTGLGLLGKEAAMTIPPLLAVAWWFDARKRTWFAATAGAALAVVAYLALRYQALLQTPDQGAQYALSLAHPPLRWIEYQLFAQIPTLPETFTTLSRGLDARVAVAAMLWLALCAAVWKARASLLGLLWIGGVAALFAVLPLGRSWNHYGYAFAALSAMVVAAAWTAAPRWGRAVIAVFALLNLAHGAALMLMFQQVGRAQANFSPALAQAVAQDRPTAQTPLRLRPADDARPWIFQRLTHEIPRYRGVEIGARVRMVEAGAAADYRIESDGRLTPLR